MFLQLVFTVSEKPGNSLWTRYVITWHWGQAPSILSLWVECSTFDKKLQTPTSPSGRKVGEVWGLLTERASSPTAQRPASQQDLLSPLYPADSTESPSTQLLLVKVKEQRRRSSCSITRARHAPATRAAVTAYMLQHAQSWWPSEKGAAEAAAWWLVGAAVLAGLCHQLLGAVLPACSL